MKICYYAGRSVGHLLSDKTPVHTLFAAPLLGELGFDMSYLDPGPLPLTRWSRIRRGFSATFSLLRASRHFDVLFSSTFTGIEFIVLLRSLGLFGKPVVVLAYTETKQGSGIKGRLFALFYRGVDRLLLSSPLNFDNARRTGYFRPGQLRLVNPGPDAAYFARIRSQFRGTAAPEGFISTGREERDFETLLKAFQGRSERLTIYVSPRHGPRDYRRFFEEHKALVGDNVTVHVLDQPMAPDAIAFETLKRSWVVCCCYPTNYNTGYTSLQEAVGLGLPFISTRNPYYGVDIEAVGIGHVFDYFDADGLRRTLDQIAATPGSAAQCRANALAYSEHQWNAGIFARELAVVFNEFNVRA